MSSSTPVSSRPDSSVSYSVKNGAIFTVRFESDLVFGLGTRGPHRSGLRVLPLPTMVGLSVTYSVWDVLVVQTLVPSPFTTDPCLLARSSYPGTGPRRRSKVNPCHELEKLGVKGGGLFLLVVFLVWSPHREEVGIVPP